MRGEYRIELKLEDCTLTFESQVLFRSDLRLHYVERGGFSRTARSFARRPGKTRSPAITKALAERLLQERERNLEHALDPATCSAPAGPSSGRRARARAERDQVEVAEAGHEGPHAARLLRESRSVKSGGSRGRRRRRRGGWAWRTGPGRARRQAATPPSWAVPPARLTSADLRPLRGEEQRRPRAEAVAHDRGS